MADKNAKWHQNTPGKFYVDDQCIACDACVVEPDFFVMNNEDGHAYVIKQPTSPAEIQNCIEALEACPVEAVGSDGD